MKEYTRLEDIDRFLDEGGSLDELIIECEPSDKAKDKNFSFIGKKIDRDIERVHHEKCW